MGFNEMESFERIRDMIAKSTARSHQIQARTKAISEEMRLLVEADEKRDGAQEFNVSSKPKFLPRIK
jgi:hypothetical protein